ncbi:inorganic triphosphatase YgiF [Bisgaardia hudsonensis]|uniref:Inorganic triphosphatase YgiF n=1 Tax=Bisgaardia hudsonensis TaxID=109472 RepID=A0A4R2N1T0_9PAST|nr:CYTH domain-containing protein [Bisgaardia hudsonensis]QLB12943.1 hypothetical protein A6A11_04635 [Bisgaardia hudsonensis]TCP13496.1 inorganic triphosphatase YgiF [Bisgaardia hudsonensis]
MTNEIEVKLVLSEEAANFFSQEISAFKILSKGNIFLENTYYDTQDLFFAHNKMGFRIRKENQIITQTLKTNGEILGGLHSRLEYNVTLSEFKPNLDKIKDIYPLHENLPKSPLIAVFSTDFNRDFWLVEVGSDTEIEIALDKGKITSRELAQSICELEFELKKGNVESLLYFIRNLNFENGVRLSATSKAKYGYLLFRGTNLDNQDWLDNWRYFLAIDEPSKLYHLFQFEQNLIEETFILGKSFFYDDFIRTIERIGMFFNLFHFYVTNDNLIKDELFEQQKKKNISYLDQLIFVNIIETNQYLLTEIQEIISQHSKTKNNQLAIDKLFTLLETGRFVKRQLDLILLTV